MSREEIHKLLGGYATGTLTPEEREALFAAALEDQELFDALAKEQPLHDLLREPAARAQLLAVLEERPEPRYRVWWRPAAAVAATAGIAVLAVLVFRGTHAPPPLEVAQVKPPESMPAPRPVASDKPAPTPERPKLKVFHLPPPAAAPALQKAEVAPPPEVVSPKLAAPQPLPVTPPPQVALGQQGGVVGGVPAAPPEARAMFYKRQDAADGAAESKPGEPRTIARVAGNAVVGAAAAGYTRLGVRYVILRKQPNGEFAAADQADLRRGDVVQLSFQPSESGYLSVTSVHGSRTRVVASGFVSRMARFTTPVLKPDDTELRVSFSRRQGTAVGGLGGTTVESSSDAGQRSTYVVGPNNGQMVIFPITLSYR
jgi:hypothetical protein